MDNLKFEDLTPAENREYIKSVKELTKTYDKKEDELNQKIDELRAECERAFDNHESEFLRRIALQRSNNERMYLSEQRKSANIRFINGFKNDTEKRIAGNLIADFDGDPDARGTWRIFGEDPNCDFGGPHHEPDLGVVEGTFKEAITYAFTLNSFISWGGGGKIRPYRNPTVKKLGV
jgi:hypothetical protein